MTEAMQYIENLNQRGSVLGLDNIKALLKVLGHPEYRVPVIHIAGTNGKGSTLAFIEHICRQAGLVVGKYTSPTIDSYYERFQIDGENISEHAFSEYMKQVMAAVEIVEAKGLYPTAFEVETALAFLYCGQADIMLLETGMGGRLDSTNVVPEPLVTVIASISMDHMQFLGDSLGMITREKAGILRPYICCVSNPSNTKSPEIDGMLRTCCEQVQAVYVPVTDPYTILEADERHTRFTFQHQEYEIHMPGLFQVENAVTAIKAVQAAAVAWMAALADDGRGGSVFPRSPHIDQGIACLTKAQVIRAGLADTKWPVRFEHIDAPVDLYMDGAHNEDACIRLKESVERYFRHRYVIMMIGILKDKAYETMMKIMAPLAQEIYTVTPQNARGLDGAVLADVCRQYCDRVTSCGSLMHACRAAFDSGAEHRDKNPVILCFGSLSYLGDMKREVQRIQGMNRFIAIFQDSEVKDRYERLGKLEADRKYCRHGINHALDVARIAYIRVLENGQDISKELIYITALLHDLGRVEQYENGISHHEAGAQFAGKILDRHGFSEEEKQMICQAIAVHEDQTQVSRSPLGNVIYLADKESRCCFACEVQASCHWDDTKKNMKLFS